MEPITLALVAMGGIAILGGGRVKSSGRGVTKGTEVVKTKGARAAMLNEIRSMSLYYSNEFGSMPFLADFLTVTGFRESNFNPNAVNKEIKTNPYNAARGLFGERPKTVFKTANGLKFMRAYPNALLNPRWAFVTAVDHVWRACRAVDRKSGRSTNFAAVRRWWGLPHLVHDFELSASYSQKSLSKLKKAIGDCNRGYGTNLSPDFIWQPIRGWQNYPGMAIMLKVYGLEQEALAAA